MNQRIVIKIATDGTTEVRTEGFVGSGCQKASDFIERALGSKQSEQLTSDYFKTSSTSETNQIQHGENQ